VNQRPGAVANVAEVMSAFAKPWALCGGWAIDAWLGRQSRDHGDIDITVCVQDGGALYEYLDGWHLVAHDAVDPGPTEELWNGRELVPPAHLHARPPGPENLAALKAWTTPPYRAANDGLDFDFELSVREGDRLVLSEEPAIHAPMGSAIAESAWGIPTLVPELLLFWKATAYHYDPRFTTRLAKDEADFRALVPKLGAPAREWLEGAIATLHPGHAWLPLLSEGQPRGSRA
jgi:hypothetical protein